MIVARVPQPSSAVADHYDELDPIYRELWGEHLHHGFWRSGSERPDQAVEALSDLVSERLGLKAGTRLVDIGCGYGATARRFAGQGAQVVGFTLSIEQTKRSPPTRGVTILCRDWLENGLDCATWDGAYAIESSEHLPDKAGFFREARRVLKQDGRLVVCAWLAREQPSSWEIRHLLEPICHEGRLPSMGSESEYRSLAAEAGFECLAFEDVSKAVAKTWTICLRRFLGSMIMRPDFRNYVLHTRNRLFAQSLPRLICAYRLGTMRYGIFTFRAR